MAQAAPLFMAGSMGLQAFGSIYQMRQQMKANVEAAKAETESALADIENLKYQEAITKSAAAADKEELFRIKDEIDGRQDAGFQKMGLSGGASAEAIRDQDDSRFYADMRKSQWKSKWQAMNFSHAAIQRGKRGISNIRNLRYSNKQSAMGTLLSVGSSSLSGASQLSTWQSRNAHMNATQPIPSYYPY